MFFDLGLVVQTRAVAHSVEEYPDFAREISVALDRFSSGDWGDISEEDAGINEDALANGDRVMGVYETSVDTIWIITEADRSATTVLFPSDY